MRTLKEKSRNILKSWSNEHNIQEIANSHNLTYNEIRNNYFKPFWRKGYLDRVSKGRYILNTKGKSKIKRDIEFLKSENIILKLSKKGLSNNEIKRKLKIKLTDSSIFSKIYRLKQNHTIDNRRIKKIDKIKINKNFYEFLGLILSDGYIGKYNIDFYNKDISLLLYYYNITKNWGQKTYQRIKDSGATEIALYSIKLVRLVNKFLNNKKSLSDEIIKNEAYQNYFLRGLFSGDGCAAISITYRNSKNRWRVEPFIALAVFNNNIMPQLLNLLKSKGYSPTFDKNCIRFSKRKDIKKFYKEIKFIKGCKIRQSKYWRGFEKNQVLKYIANFPDKSLKCYLTKDKNQIVSHIKKKLIE